MSRIYFILCPELEAVKIGYTRGEPVARLAALQTGCPVRLHGLASVPGSREEEQKLHQAFEPLHLQGEWFSLEGKLATMVLYLRQRGPRADRDAFLMALHDVLMQGGTLDDGPPTDEYFDTGDWKPFHDLLWQNFGPWEPVH